MAKFKFKINSFGEITDKSGDTNFLDGDIFKKKHKQKQLAKKWKKEAQKSKPKPKPQTESKQEPQPQLKKEDKPEPKLKPKPDPVKKQQPPPISPSKKTPAVSPRKLQPKPLPPKQPPQSPKPQPTREPTPKEPTPRKPTPEPHMFPHPRTESCDSSTDTDDPEVDDEIKAEQILKLHEERRKQLELEALQKPSFLPKRRNKVNETAGSNSPVLPRSNDPIWDISDQLDLVDTSAVI